MAARLTRRAKAVAENADTAPAVESAPRATRQRSALAAIEQPEPAAKPAEPAPDSDTAQVRKARRTARDAASPAKKAAVAGSPSGAALPLKRMTTPGAASPVTFATPLRQAVAQSPTPSSATRVLNTPPGSAVRPGKTTATLAATPLGRLAAFNSVGSPNVSAIAFAGGDTSILTDAGSSPGRSPTRQMPSGETVIEDFLQAQKPQKRKARPIRKVCARAHMYAE